MSKFNNKSQKIMKSFPDDLFDVINIGGEADFKILYLRTLLDNDYSIRTINSTISLFNKLEKWENLFEKDFYNFDINQTKLIYKDLKRPSLASLTSEKSVLEKYLYFALDNKKINAATHPSFGLSKDDLIELVNTKGRKNKFITYNEYLELLENCQNSMDKAFIILIWHGLYNKDLELIRSIKVSDIDIASKKIKNIDIDFADEEFKVFIDTVKQTMYIDEKTLVSRDLAKSEYLFKPCGKDKENDTTQPLLIKRFSRITAKINNRDLKIRSLYGSGVFYRVLDKLNDPDYSNAEYFKYMLENKISRGSAEDIRKVLLEKYTDENKDA